MSQLSILELFTIGIGPSSSHTVGPMRAASRFIHALEARPDRDRISRICVTCYGSLAATGKGHGTDKAIVLGLTGDEPETTDVDTADSRFQNICIQQELTLPWGERIKFCPINDVDMSHHVQLPLHPNGMHCAAYDAEDNPIFEEVFYSTGGGYIETEEEFKHPVTSEHIPAIHTPYIYHTATDLISLCDEHHLNISDIAFANEKAFRSEDQIRAQLKAIKEAMGKCIRRGLTRGGILPGGLNVPRRAKQLYKSLMMRGESALRDPLAILDWVNLYALAVNEENAAGGRVVTAPTNGAAGIIPAVLEYATKFCYSPYPDGTDRFLLTAGLIALLYKTNASISGADVGCQGEVGVACSMAAAALTEYLGGNPHQVENAAEIAMEHNLGLTCDPIAGLVQIPCIERNAMAAIKAINAARMALNGNGKHFVPLDKVMRTMLQTGHDMQSKYKETAQGGLAVNVVAC